VMSGWRGDMPSRAAPAPARPGASPEDGTPLRGWVLAGAGPDPQG